MGSQGVREFILEIDDFGIEHVDLGDGSTNDRFEDLRRDGVRDGGHFSEPPDEFGCRLTRPGSCADGRTGASGLHREAPPTVGLDSRPRMPVPLGMSTSSNAFAAPGQCSDKIAHSWFEDAVRTSTNAIRARTSVASSASGLSYGFDPAQPVMIGAGVVGEHERVSRVGLRTCRTPPRSRSLERCRLDHQHRVTCAGDAPYRQTLTTLDRDRDACRITQLGEFGEERRDAVLGVLDHPGLDYHPVVVDCADAVPG